MRGDEVKAVALAVNFAVVCGFAGAAVAQERARQIACGGTAIARGAARRAIDGRTFVLGDGREIRLAAIEVPPLPLPRQADAPPGGTAAKDALAARLTGAEIIVRGADVATDRYGRLFAFAFAVRGGAERSVQADLIAGGFARVADRVGSRDCAAELLRREQAARKAKLGLWANSYYDVLDADKPADVLAQKGRFALVEGKVLSVRQSGATVYVNFGRRWSEDFTVTIRRRSAGKFAAAGLAPKRLAGQRIRVRGWIEERGGPWVEAARPEQIELADHE